jgi:hypothetical protein
VRASLLAGLCALGLLVAACGGKSTPGTATAPARVTTPTSARPAADPLAKVDPCSLISDSTAQHNGLTGKHGPFDDNGSRACSWDRVATDEAASYSFGIDIFDHSGYQDIDSSGMTVTPYTIGSRKAIVVQDDLHKGCLVNLDITASSHVEVAVVMENGDVDAACTVAKPAAAVVAGNLPAGA